MRYIMWHLDDKEPIYVQIYEQIKKMILEKKYIENQKLPSKRGMADSLKVSPMTVDVAYQQLMAEGYIYSKPKSGYFVEKDLDTFIPVKTVSNQDIDMKKSVKTYPYAFKTNVVDTSLFPYATWSKLTRTVLLDYQHALLNESDPQGLYELRLEIAKYLDIHRGISIDPSQIIIGSGSTSLMTLLVELLGRDKHYAIENPSYQKKHQLYKGQNVSLSLIGLDGSGMDIRELKRKNVDVIHITTSHQFPTGVVMPISRRIELLNWANQTNRYIIEDDYDSEFRFSGKPIPALTGLNQDKIIYMNTFTKTLAPSFRMNYMVLPKDLLKHYLNHLTHHSCTVPLLEQYVLYLFMKQGSFDRHINKMKKRYKQKVDLITDILSLYPFIKIKHFDAGLHGIIEVKTKKMPDCMKAFEMAGIDIKSMDDFYLDYPRKSVELVLGYAGIPIESLEKNIKMLAETIKKHCS